jgi:hypothetical protein
MFYALVSIQAPLGAHRVRPLAGPMAGSAIQSPRMDSGLLRGAKSAARNDGVEPIMTTYMIRTSKSLY